MKTLKYLLILLAFVKISVAETIPRYALHYIHHMLSLEEEQDASFQYFDPRIYLYRFFMDISGDHIPEVFIGSSSLVDRSPILWSIYSNDNSELIYRDFLSTTGFNLLRGDDFVQITRVTGKREIIYDRVKFIKGKFHERERKLIEGEEAMAIQGNNENWEDALGFGSVYKPKIEKILLAELLVNKEFEWRSYYHNRAPDEQYQDPADADKISICEKIDTTSVFDQYNNLVDDFNRTTNDKLPIFVKQYDRKAISNPKRKEQKLQSGNIGPIKTYPPEQVKIVRPIIWVVIGAIFLVLFSVCKTMRVNKK